MFVDNIPLAVEDIMFGILNGARWINKSTWIDGTWLIAWRLIIESNVLEKLCIKAVVRIPFLPFITSNADRIDVLPSHSR